MKNSIMKYGKKSWRTDYIISLREIGCLPHLLSQPLFLIFLTNEDEKSRITKTVWF